MRPNPIELCPCILEKGNLDTDAAQRGDSVEMHREKTAVR